MSYLNDILRMNINTNEIGVYNLTPVQAFLINKNLPFGIKLILENDYNKKIISNSSKNKSNNLLEKKIKRIKKITSNNSNTNNTSESSKKKLKYNKIINDKNHIDLNLIVKYKCLIFLTKISEIDLEPIFIYNNPSLRDIENDVNQNKYISFFQFKLSIRKFWLHFYKNKKNKKVLQQTEKLCILSEDIFSQIDKLPENIIIQEYNKLILKDKISLFKTKSLSKNLNFDEKIKINNKKDNTSINKFDDSYLNEEKNILIEKIKCLTQYQLTGIIPLLSDFFSNINNVTDQYVEFDIEKLNQEQILKVEKYVEECIKVNIQNKIHTIINNSNINCSPNNKNNKINNDNNNNIFNFNFNNNDNNNSIQYNDSIINNSFFENQNSNENISILNILKNAEDDKNSYSKKKKNNNKENSNNDLFTENSFYNLNKSFEQTKLENSNLFNPLNISNISVVSEKNIFPDASLDFFINKESSKKSNYSYNDSDYFDFH